MTNCPKCGTPYKEGYKFCKKCGTKFDELVGVKISPEVEAKMDILQKKIAAEPLNAELYIELGDIYNKNDLLAEALIQYQKSTNIDESNIDAHLKSGDVYFEMKELEKAKKSYQTALGINPESSEAQLGLFRTYYAEENLEKAIELGEEFVRAEPKNVEVHKALKEIYLQKGMKEKAFEEMRTISALLPDDKKASMEMGIQFLVKEQYEKASECYEGVLKVDSDDLDARFRMGELSCFKGDYHEAIRYLEDTVEKLSPEPMSIARMYLALAYINLEKSDKALKEIALVVKPKSEDLLNQHKKLFAEAYYKIGGALLENNLSVAIDYLEKATKYEPQNLEYKNRLEKTRDQQRTAIKKSKRKRAFAATGAIAILVLAFAVWYLSHGRVLIKVTPERAAVYVDGEKIFKKFKGSYLSPSLFFGKHTLTVKKDGYENWGKEIDIGYGKTVTIGATLEPIYVEIQISTQPSGADVYVYNEHKGKSPIRFNLLAKKHKISSRLGSQKVTEEITLEKGNNKKLHITFRHLKKTGNLNYARGYGHKLTLLEDGRVLLTGGISGGRYLSSCELYDPVTQKWSVSGNLRRGRYYHSATLIGDGKVLIAGGYIKGRWKKQTTRSSEIFDLDTGRSTYTGKMTFRGGYGGYVGRAYHSAILLKDGNVLIGGGYSQGNGAMGPNTIELYDQRRGIWKETGFPGRGAYLFLLDGGQIASFDDDLYAFYVFDRNNPETNKYYETHMDPSAILLLNDSKILIIGRGRRAAQRYGYRTLNPRTGYLTDFKKIDIDFFEILESKMTLLASGEVALVSDKSAKIYREGVWENIEELKVGRRDFEVTPLQNGDLLIVGGYDINGKDLRSSEILVTSKFSEEILE